VKKNTNRFISALFLIIVVSVALIPCKVSAQYDTWYKKAQERIDTIRKGSFGIKIIDKDGQIYSGPVSVRMVKHEFPFGIAFDFYQGEVSMGNSFSSAVTVQAKEDKEIYQTERWNNYLAYAIPVESGKEYKLTLKFAEIYFGTANSRIFNVNVEGQLFLDKYDVFVQAGGKNIAKDTSITITATDDFLNIELKASRDNAAIKGIIVEETGGNNIIRINCGGPVITTSDGNMYLTESGYFDADVNTVATEEQWMKASMYKYFNYGVSGNSFKWSGIQPQYTAPNYTNFDNAVNWTRKVGWDLRAHTLLWGGYEYTGDHEMPRWVKDLPTAQAITDTCKMRVIREMTRYKGIVKEYDVMNEPLHAKYLADSLVGDSINWNCFKWAYSADPGAKLFINEYNVEYGWGDAKKYRDLILKIKNMGGPVSGVGMQAHFWNGLRPNISDLVTQVNTVAEAGLPIKFTEYDYGGDISQAEQAADFIKVLTIAFSHPSIEGMVCWALSDAGAWRENTGFFEANHKPKLAADTLLYYTKTKWATNFDSLITIDEALKFEAYYGQYNIEVKFNDTVKVFTIPCLKQNSDSTFTLYESDAILMGPKLVKAELDGDNSVRLIFDKPIQENSVKRSNFKFFSGSAIGIENAQVDANNESNVLLTLSKSVTKGSYLSVSYFPGSLLSSDGGKAKPFGPESLYNPASTVETEMHSIASLNVYPNPASDIFTIENATAPFHLSIYNLLGRLIYSEDSEFESMNVDVSSFNRGIYIIRLNNSDDSFLTKKLILK